MLPTITPASAPAESPRPSGTSREAGSVVLGGSPSPSLLDVLGMAPPERV